MLRWLAWIGSAAAMTTAAHAADHFDVKAADAPKAIERAVKEPKLNIVLTKVLCVTGNTPDQKDICTYKAGDGMLLKLSATTTKHDVNDATLICTPVKSSIISECAYVYDAMVRVFTPNLTGEKVDEIVQYLGDGIAIVDDVQIKIDGNTYSMRSKTKDIDYSLQIEPGMGRD